jgi:hypothetical protein
MAGLLHADMLAEIASPSRELFAYAEFQYGGTIGTKRYSDWPRSSDTLGDMAGKVVAGGWGRINRAVSDRDNSLTLSSTTLTIEDTDRSFAVAIATRGRALRGTRVIWRLGSPNVAPANWATVFDGFLDKKSRRAPFEWVTTLHPADLPLQGVFPKTPILPSDWPNLGDATLTGEYVPILYGIHDSRATSDGGMVPCPYVDRVGFRYLVSQGWVNVTRIYKDGQEQTPSGSWAITHPTINGRLFTLIDYTSDQGTAKFTADVEGYEDVGDGSGTLLTGADALQHLLVNFVYGDYQGGNWLSVGTTPVSTSLFAAAQAFLERQGWEKVSRRYGGQQQTLGTEAVNEWCSTLQVPALFTRDGKLGLGVNDHATTVLWHDWPAHIRYDLDEVGAEGGTLDLDYDRDSLTSRISVQYMRSEASNKYVYTGEVRDLSQEDVASSLAMPWSHASLVA